MRHVWCECTTTRSIDSAAAVEQGEGKKGGTGPLTRRVQLGVIDDHPVTRLGFELLFSAVPDVHLVATAATVEELLDFAEIGADLRGLDVILLDLYLTGHVPSWSVIGKLAARVPVLMMSASRHRDDVVDAIRSGASGYLTKDAEREEFATAVRTVAAGEFFLSSELADMVGGALAGGIAEPELSVREEETLSLIASGFTHAQTARRMGISKATVDTYVERIRRKLQVGNKAELTRAALRRRTGSPHRPPSPPMDAESVSPYGRAGPASERGVEKECLE